MTTRKSSKSRKINANIDAPVYLYVTLLVLTRNGEWKRHQDTVSERNAIRNAYLPAEHFDCSKVRQMLIDHGEVKLSLSHDAVDKILAKLDEIPVTSLDEAKQILKAKGRIERMVAYKSAVPKVASVVLRAGWKTEQPSPKPEAAEAEFVF